MLLSDECPEIYPNARGFATARAENSVIRES
jgi:hypothetical protein